MRGKSAAFLPVCSRREHGTWPGPPDTDGTVVGPVEMPQRDSLVCSRKTFLSLGIPETSYEALPDGRQHASEEKELCE